MELGPDRIVGGKVRLERPLARGGMGSLWEGIHLGLDVRVAVKFMDDAGDRTEDRRTRFAREARAAASLKSPHVVQVMDFDAAGPHPYIVMEMLEGEDLGQRIDARGRLGLGEAAHIVTQIAEGLEAAHAAGIVHRDLKPSNIFLARNGDREVVKILDFGVAKTTRLDGADHQTTTAGVVVGSPSYMSPEQARGQSVDARSDLWSLGVLLFHAITGRRPFEGRNLGDVLVKICTDRVPLASEVLPGLPVRVDAFFERALCRSPDGRFASARELAAAFAEIGRSTPEVAGSVSGAGPVSEASGRPRDEATASLVVPPSSVRAETEAATQVEVRPVGLAVTSTVDPLTSTAAETSRRRTVAWVAGAALLVVAGWGATRGRIFQPELASPGPASATPASSMNGAAIAEPGPSAVPDVRPVPVVPSPTSTPEPSTSPSGSQTTPARPPSRPPVVRPRPVATGAIDPKFGLPTDGRRP